MVFCYFCLKVLFNKRGKYNIKHMQSLNNIINLKQLKSKDMKHRHKTQHSFKHKSGSVRKFMSIYKTKTITSKWNHKPGSQTCYKYKSVMKSQKWPISYFHINLQYYPKITWEFAAYIGAKNINNLVALLLNKNPTPLMYPLLNFIITKSSIPNHFFRSGF